MHDKEPLIPQTHHNCLVCGKSNFSFWARDGHFDLVQCKECGFVWVEPYFSLQQLKQLYQGYIHPRLNDDSFTHRNIQYVIDRDFVLQFIQGGTMLDIGCSGGFFLSNFGPSFTKYGIDIDSDSVAYAREHFAFGENVIQATAAEADFSDTTFDLITIRGVIQYMTDLDEQMPRLFRWLKPGGLLYLCATPNVESFCARLFREKWSLLNPQEHLWQFSPKTLRQLMARHGFIHIAADYPYLETTYASPDDDHRRVLEATAARQRGEELPASPPFWGNMMNMVFRR